jgi:hypothetical protein
VNGPIIFHCISAGPLLLGRNVLSALHLYFAFKEENLYVTAADAAAPAAQLEDKSR